MTKVTKYPCHLESPSYAEASNMPVGGQVFTGFQAIAKSSGTNASVYQVQDVAIGTVMFRDFGSEKAVRLSSILASAPEAEQNAITVSMYVDPDWVDSSNPIFELLMKERVQFHTDSLAKVRERLEKLE